MTVTSVTELAHREATEVSVAQAAAMLKDLLTRRLTVYIVGVKDGKTVARWISGDTKDIRPESERRLRTTYGIAKLLLQVQSPETTRAWFIGLNPDLEDMSPAEAIHNGQLKEALGAARAFVGNG